MKITTLDVSILNRDESIAAYLIELPSALILVDCGPESQYPKLVEQLKKKGYQPQDITHVLPTHIHLDHAGGAWRFAELGAKIYLHPLGAKHLIDPSVFLDSATRIYKEKMQTLWGTLKPIAKEQVIITADNQCVSIDQVDFLAMHTPGHAKHHICWVVQDKIFAGDTGGCRIAPGPVIAPTPPPDLDFDLWEQSIQKMEATQAKSIWITHYGKFDDMQQHYAALRESLDDLYKKTEAYYDLGMQSEEISLRLLDNFEALLKKLTNQSDADSDLVASYQAINPLWMNAQGLYRYWHKKKSSPA